MTDYITETLRKYDLSVELDDGVETWHTSPNETRPLHEFLGLTVEEYALWVTDPTAAVDLIYARKYPQ